jgi:hypothetical protein
MECTVAFHSRDTAIATANPRSDEKDSTIASTSRYKGDRDEAEGREAEADTEVAAEEEDEPAAGA